MGFGSGDSAHLHRSDVSSPLPSSSFGLAQSPSPAPATASRFSSASVQISASLRRWAALHELAWLLFALWIILWRAPRLILYSQILWLDCSCLILSLLIFSQIRYRESAKDLGLSLTNFWPAMRELAVPLLGFVLASVAIGAFSHSLRLTKPQFFLALLLGPSW